MEGHSELFEAKWTELSTDGESRFGAESCGQNHGWLAARWSVVRQQFSSRRWIPGATCVSTRMSSGFLRATASLRGITIMNRGNAGLERLANLRRLRQSWLASRLSSLTCLGAQPKMRD